MATLTAADDRLQEVDEYAKNEERSREDMAIGLNIPTKYRQDIENAAKFLKNEGCEAVFLFGSLVTGKIHDDSDIDIGIKGYPTGNFFKLYSRLYFDFDVKIDLVDFDTNSDFYEMLNEIGEVVQIG